MRITQVRIAPVHVKNDLLGYADITIDDCFRVRDLKILRQPTGYAIAMPQAKLKSGKYKEIAFALNAKTRKMIKDTVIAEYENMARKRPH